MTQSSTTADAGASLPQGGTGIRIDGLTKTFAGSRGRSVTEKVSATYGTPLSA